MAPPDRTQEDARGHRRDAPPPTGLRSTARSAQRRDSRHFRTLCRVCFVEASARPVCCLRHRRGPPPFHLRRRPRMTASGQRPPNAVRRLGQHWRDLWRRGHSRLSPDHEAEIAHQLLLDDGDDRDAENGEQQSAACAVCRLRARTCRRWLADLPLSGAQPGEASAYCPRHLRLLLATPEGQEHLLGLLPGRLAAAHAAVHPTTRIAGTALLDPAATPRGCSTCQWENETETRAVHAAASLLAGSTGALPRLSRLDLCHEHTLQVAARIVGRLGPEPRAIPDLHMLLSSHRRRLRHLIAYDRQHIDELGRALVVACDADTPVPQLQLGFIDAQDPAPHRCTACASAAADAHSVLSEVAENLIDSGHRRHRHAELSLCRAHLRNLIDHLCDQERADDRTLLNGIARAQLDQLAPALDWLDSGFGHPHTIRHAVAELTESRPCPACTAHVEGQRHALAMLTTLGELATQPHGQSAPVCLRHSARLAADHPARARLAEALGSTTAVLQGQRTDHLASVSAGGGGVSAADAPSGGWSLRDRLIHALGLLDGRIHYGTAGAADDPIP